MRVVYPVVFTPLENEGGYLAYVPDLQINTSGEDLPDAIYMARDAISLTGIVMEDDGKTLPPPSMEVPHHPNEIVTFVDADLTEYRRSIEQKTVRRNVSLPSWLDFAANKAGLNVSAVLQAALKQQLNLQ